MFSTKVEISSTGLIILHQMKKWLIFSRKVMIINLHKYVESCVMYACTALVVRR